MFFSEQCGICLWVLQSLEIICNFVFWTTWHIYLWDLQSIELICKISFLKKLWHLFLASALLWEREREFARNYGVRLQYVVEQYVCQELGIENICLFCFCKMCQLWSVISIPLIFLGNIWYVFWVLQSI